MKRLGLNAYRFSIAWGRVMPQGRGANEAASASTNASATLARTAASSRWPRSTTGPATALDDRGGWLNPDIADWFADYASVMIRRLDDRVKLWATLNEPWVVTDGGYLTGALAPGHKNRFEAPIASHHLMRAHGKAVQAYRALGKHQVGLVVNIEPKYPASQAPQDLAATRRAEAYMNGSTSIRCSRPLPGRDARDLRRGLPEWPQQDHELIRQPIDFLGVNYYTRSVVRQTRPPTTEVGGGAAEAVGLQRDRLGVFPQGLTDTLVWIKQQYGDIPQYITENGAAFYDPPRRRRAASTTRAHRLLPLHLRAVHDAMRAGVDIRGYCAWSLMDNLEWSLGFSKRFGLVHVNFETSSGLEGQCHFLCRRHRLARCRPRRRPLSIELVLRPPYP